MFPVVFPTLVVIGAIVQLFVQKQPRTTARTTEVFARWLIVVGIFAFLGHALMPDRVAEEIGFPIDNPFPMGGRLGPRRPRLLGPGLPAPP